MSVSGPSFNINAIKKLNELELKFGVDTQASWHNKVRHIFMHLHRSSFACCISAFSLLQYKDSSYIFIGGLDYRMTEGDVIIIFSQWGEVRS
jgi:RNA-binding motif protein, X-linked 2